MSLRKGGKTGRNRPPNGRVVRPAQSGCVMSLDAGKLEYARVFDHRDFDAVFTATNDVHA